MQRILERISLLVGRPGFLGFILIFVAIWIVANAWLLRHLGMSPFDPAPFPWLQGIITLGGLLTTTVVLGKQNRLAKLAERQAHLDLKVTLLTEQKTAKLIHLLEELRRDLPDVKDRHDPEAAALQHSMKPEQVLAALDERAEPDDAANPLKRSRMKETVPHRLPARFSLLVVSRANNSWRRNFIGHIAPSGAGESCWSTRRDDTSA